MKGRAVLRRTIPTLSLRPRSIHIGFSMLVDDSDEVGIEPSSAADSDLVWSGLDPTTTINSMIERNDRIRGGKELQAFVVAHAIDDVFPKSVCAEYFWEAISKSQSGVGLKGANRSHFKQRAAAFSSQDK